MAIGYFGQGDVIRQMQYRQAQRRGWLQQAHPLDPGAAPLIEPQSVNALVPAASRGATPMSGFFSDPMMGFVPVRTAAAGLLTASTGGLAAPLLAADLKSLSHLKKLCEHHKKHYAKAKAKGASSKHLKKIKEKYDKACGLYALKKKEISRRKTYRGLKKQVRKGQLTGDEAVAKLTGSRMTARRTVFPSTQQAATIAASTATMVPPSSFTRTDAVTAAATGMELTDLDAGADDAGDMIEAGDSGGGIAAFIKGIPTWGWIVGALGIGLLAFGGSANGRRFLRRVSKGKFPKTTGAAAAK